MRFIHVLSQAVRAFRIMISTPKGRAMSVRDEYVNVHPESEERIRRAARMFGEEYPEERWELRLRKAPDQNKYRLYVTDPSGREQQNSLHPLGTGFRDRHHRTPEQDAGSVAKAEHGRNGRVIFLGV